MSTSIADFEKYLKENSFESTNDYESKLRQLQSLEENVEAVKSLSTNLSLHKGSAADQSNVIKTDCCLLCDRYQLVGEQLLNYVAKVKLVQENSGSVENSVSGEITIIKPDSESPKLDETICIQKSEVYLVLDNPSEMKEQQREQSKLEADLLQCNQLLANPVILQDSHNMSEFKEKISSHFHLFDDAFIPVHLSEEETADLVEQMKQTKTELLNCENEVDNLLNTMNQWKEEIQAEIEAGFLGAVYYNLNPVSKSHIQSKNNPTIKGEMTRGSQNYHNYNCIWGKGSVVVYKYY